MRKVMGVLVLFLLVVAPLQAQATYAIDKGAVVLDGSISFTSSGGDLYENTAGDRASSITAMPAVMYFVMPGLAVGGQLLLDYSKQGDVSATSLGVGPSVAYFFGGPDASVFPFVQGTFDYVHTKIDLGGGDDFSASGWGVTGAVGAAFMLTKTVALIGDAFYRIESAKPQGGDSVKGNVFGISLGVGAFIF